MSQIATDDQIIWDISKVQTEQSQVRVESGPGGNGGVESVRCPSLESLRRRYEASDKNWMAEWLADEKDPTNPA